MAAAVAANPPAYDVVMFSFDGTQTAARVLTKLKEENALEGCEIEGEALISRDAAGQVHFHERGSAGVGATFGAVTAGILGLVGGPVFLLIMLVAGGVAGGVAGHFAGQLLPPEDLRKVGQSLPPGSSAYLALVDAAHADGIAAAFGAEGATAINIPVETELASVIREAITHRVTRV
jgi:uncharacterized membrane protein